MLTKAILDEALTTAAGLRELSPPSLVLTGAVAQAVAPILSDVAVDVAAKLGSTIADTVGSLASAVPVLGTFVGLATGFLSMANALQAQEAQRVESLCKQFISIRKIIPSGSKLGGCDQCPCDLFRVTPLPGGMSFRSVLGQALVAITEGDDFGELDLIPIRPTSESYARERSDLIRQITGAGPDEKRRNKYRALRVAMERSFVEPGGPSSDGGVAWWPAYLDMLLTDIESGVITKEYADLCIWALYLPKLGNGAYWNHPSYLPTADLIKIKDAAGNKVARLSTRGAPKGALYFGAKERRCFDPWLRESIFTMAEEWRNTIRPRYEDGKRALAELEALAMQYRSRQGGLLGDLAPARPSLLRFVLGTAAVGALGLGIARPALALAAARRAAGLARRAGGAVRAVVTR